MCQLVKAAVIVVMVAIVMKMATTASARKTKASTFPSAENINLGNDNLLRHLKDELQVSVSEKHAKNFTLMRDCKNLMTPLRSSSKCYLEHILQRMVTFKNLLQKTRQCVENRYSKSNMTVVINAVTDYLDPLTKGHMQKHKKCAGFIMGKGKKWRRDKRMCMGTFACKDFPCDKDETVFLISSGFQSFLEQFRSTNLTECNKSPEKKKKKKRKRGGKKNKKKKEKAKAFLGALLDLDTTKFKLSCKGQKGRITLRVPSEWLTSANASTHLRESCS